MIKSFLTAAAVVVFGLAACAPSRHQSTGPEADLLAVQKKLSEAEEKIDRLAQRVTLIQIIVDSQQRTLQDLAGDTAAGDTGIDINPAPPTSEKKEAVTVSEIPPLVTKTEKAAPVSEAAPSESSPGPPLFETAQNPDSRSTPEPQEVEATQSPEPQSTPEPEKVETASRPEKENRLVVPGPNPAYQEAMDVFRRGDYEAAGGLFEKFALDFPKDDLADNALYWSGECRYTRKDYTGALKQFRQVIEDYPSGSKVPDALLKIGFAYLSLGDKDSAITYLKKVVAKYPFSTAGTKAEERLKELRK